MQSDEASRYFIEPYKVKAASHKYTDRSECRWFVVLVVQSWDPFTRTEERRESLQTRVGRNLYRNRKSRLPLRIKHQRRCDDMLSAQQPMTSGLWHNQTQTDTDTHLHSREQRIFLSGPDSSFRRSWLSFGIPPMSLCSADSVSPWHSAKQSICSHLTSESYYIHCFSILITVKVTNALGDQHYSKWESVQDGGQWFWLILPDMSLTWHKQHGAAIYEDVNSGEAVHHFVIFFFFVSLRSCRFTVLVRSLHPLVGVKVINWGLLMLHFKMSFSNSGMITHQVDLISFFLNQKYQ